VKQELENSECSEASRVLAQPHSRPPTILIDELNADRFERAANGAVVGAGQ
jgi:hypothetical protein